MLCEFLCTDEHTRLCPGGVSAPCPQKYCTTTAVSVTAATDPDQGPEETESQRYERIVTSFELITNEGTERHRASTPLPPVSGSREEALK